MLSTETHDTLLPVSWRSRPGDFVSLMTLYESNYVRLHEWLPQLTSMNGDYVSTPDDDCPLLCRIEEHARYTTTFMLTYQFESAAGNFGDPDLHVRAYHDAHMAEVLSCARWHQHGALTSIKSSLRAQLNDRWLRNMMLNKWLEYCVERGHYFAMK
jgi:uncharacterized protein YqiB (DUF1249 family)